MIGTEQDQSDAPGEIRLNILFLLLIIASIALAAFFSQADDLYNTTTLANVPDCRSVTHGHGGHSHADAYPNNRSYADYYAHGHSNGRIANKRLEQAATDNAGLLHAKIDSDAGASQGPRRHRLPGNASGLAPLPHPPR